MESHEQAGCPLGDKPFNGQIWHDVAPNASLKVLAAHKAHCCELGRAVNCPVGQLEHDVVELGEAYVPTPHGMHAVWPVTLVYDPMGHVGHDSNTAGCLAKVPTGHVTHGNVASAA